jgi:hypothetical protein
VIVTVDPAARKIFNITVTDKRLFAPAKEVLCWIDLTLKVGTATVNGSAPLATPYSAVPGFTIAADAIDPTLLLLPSSITATTLTDGDD